MKYVPTMVFLILFSMTAMGTEYTYCKVNLLDGATMDLKLDFKRPAVAQSVPALVFIHGGGLVRGSRLTYLNELDRANAMGFAALTIDYRLTINAEDETVENDQPNDEYYQVGAKAPAGMRDVQCAIKWLKSNALSLGIDPSRIGIQGHSAGGYLALMLATASAAPIFNFTPMHQIQFVDGNLAQMEVHNTSVQAVSHFAGPNNIANWQNTEEFHPAVVEMMENLFFTLSLEDIPSHPMAIRISPFYHLSTFVPPILAFHGRSDDLVPWQQTESFHNQNTQSFGNTQTTYFIEGEEHMYTDMVLCWMMDKVYEHFDKVLLQNESASLNSSIIDFAPSYVNLGRCNSI